MGKADVFESDYLENAEVFADLVNGVLYQGKQVVKPQELEEQDGELRGAEGNSAKKLLRDKVRLWKGRAFAVFVIENQTKVDYHMVLRAMLAESMAYDKQWKKQKGKRKAEKDKVSSDEFISGMRKEDRFIPIITIVVYYGTDKPWDGARTLHELLDAEGAEENILPFVSNYRLNVYDYHEYDSFECFHSELQSVFEFLRYADDRKSLTEKLTEHRERYEKLSARARVLLTQLTNTKKIPDIKEEDFQKGEFSMCKAFEDMEKKGRAVEIVETGHEFHFSDSKILERLQNKLNISMEEARGYFIEIEEEQKAFVL